jgi:hypothetical protein
MAKRSNIGRWPPRCMLADRARRVPTSTVIARGIFASVTDLRRKLMRYIKHYNKTAKPFRWSYADPTRRIA